MVYKLLFPPTHFFFAGTTLASKTALLWQASFSVSAVSSYFSLHSQLPIEMFMYNIL